jgi:hypothetical protein
MVFVGCARQDGVDGSGEGIHVVFWQRREELRGGFFPDGEPVRRAGHGEHCRRRRGVSDEPGEGRVKAQLGIERGQSVDEAPEAAVAELPG